MVAAGRPNDQVVAAGAGDRIGAAAATDCNARTGTDVSGGVRSDDRERMDDVGFLARRECPGPRRGRRRHSDLGSTIENLNRTARLGSSSQCDGSVLVEQL